MSKKNAAAKPAVRKPRFSALQVKTVLARRAKGASYSELSEYLGQPKDHGATAFRLLKSLEAAKPAKPAKSPAKSKPAAVVSAA